MKIRLDLLSLLTPVLILMTTLGVMLFVWFFLLSGEVFLAVAGLGFLMFIILRELSNFPKEIMFNENEIVVKNIFLFSRKSLYTNFVHLDEARCSLLFKDLVIPLRYASNFREVLLALSDFVPSKNIDLQRDLRKEFSLRNKVFITTSVLAGGILLFLVYLGFDFWGERFFIFFLGFILLGIVFLSDHVSTYLLKK